MIKHKKKTKTQILRCHSSMLGSKPLAEQFQTIAVKSLSGSASTYKKQTQLVNSFRLLQSKVDLGVPVHTKSKRNPIVALLGSRK